MSFPPKIIRQAKARAAGRCEGCGTPISPSNPGQCHHKDATWKRNKPDHSLGNALYLGQKCCHRAISDADTKIRAKADRQRVSALEGKKSKYPPLPGCKRSGWKRTFSGWERR